MGGAYAPPFDPVRSVAVEFSHSAKCRCEVCTNPNDYRNRLILDPCSADTPHGKRSKRFLRRGKDK